VTKEKIINYLTVGNTKSICIDKCLTDEYPGYVRETTIMSGNIVRVEFNNYGYDEGGLTIKVYYKDLDELLTAIQEFIGAKIEDWENYNVTGGYPTLEQEVDFESSGKKLKEDLVKKTIKIPLNGCKNEIPEGYWKDIADGKLSI